MFRNLEVYLTLPLLEILISTFGYHLKTCMEHWRIDIRTFERSVTLSMPIILKYFRRGLTLNATLD